MVLVLRDTWFRTLHLMLLIKALLMLVFVLARMNVCVCSEVWRKRLLRLLLAAVRTLLEFLAGEDLRAGGNRECKVYFNACFGKRIQPNAVEYYCIHTCTYSSAVEKTECLMCQYSSETFRVYAVRPLKGLKNARVGQAYSYLSCE
jgi:hypothetical protein